MKYKKEMQGLKMKKDARRIERGAVEDFAKISNPGVSIFVEKLTT